MNIKLTHYLFLSLIFALFTVAINAKADSNAWCDHDHYRKPGQIPLIEYRLKQNIAPFEFVDLNLTILKTLLYKTKDLELKVTAESGIEITQAPAVSGFKAWRMQFKATEYGRHYLNVYVRQKNVNNVERFIPKVQQVFSIPIQVGEADD